jgi:arylsulfatase
MGLIPRSLACALTIACGCSEPQASIEQPHIFLITVDTLRADHLGAYGYDKDTSPNLDAFADGATLFENAISQAPHTIPSLLQIMTSRYDQGRKLEAGRPTLASLLREAGYQTVAVIDNPILEASRESNGLVHGFQRYYRNGPIKRGDPGPQHDKTNTPADTITAQAKRALRELNTQKPIFMWLHYFDPHDPYMPPFHEDMESLTWDRESEYLGDIRSTALFWRHIKPDPEFDRTDRQTLVDLYDAEIRYWDQSFGDWLAHLKQNGLLESSLFVVTSDHGEGFDDHGTWAHGKSLYDEEIHVPLLVKLPGQTSRERRTDPAQGLDIAPTILGVASVRPAVPPMHGRDLRVPSREPAMSFWRDWKAVRTARHKLIQRGEDIMLFDLERDPAETINLASEETELVAELVAAQARRVQEIETESDRIEKLSEEAVQLMKAIGYME